MKSYRKFYQEDGVLFHFCMDCFGLLLRSVSFGLVEFEIRFRCRSGCVASVLMGGDSLVCDSCVNFVIENFSGDYFKTV